MKTLRSKTEGMESEPVESRVGLRASNPQLGRPAVLRYVVALACVLAAFAVRYLLTPILGDELPFMLFIAASLVAAWYGGAATGIAALMLGLFLADYFFMAQEPAPTSERTIELLHLVRYIFTASVGISIIEVLHRGRRRTQAALEELQREVARRVRTEEALREAKELLGQQAGELELRVAERTERLSETVASLEDLLYHIAHNLRAPLRAMQGYTRMMEEEQGDKPAGLAKEYSTQIIRASERMDRLIHDLLDYGRLCHEDYPLNAVGLQRLIEVALFRLAGPIGASNAEVNVAGPLPQVRGNAKVLEEVLTHLIDNALKFIRPGINPRITIRAELRGPRARLWIEDNGIGVERQYQDRIFGAFQQLHAMGAYGGTGIGLAIVKQGMRRMAGGAGVESEVGMGSKFWVELPAMVKVGEVQVSKELLQEKDSGEPVGSRD